MCSSSFLLELAPKSINRIIRYHLREILINIAARIAKQPSICKDKEIASFKSCHG